MRTGTLVALAVVLSLAGTARPAAALGSGAYEVEVLVDGRPLDEMPARGTTYVEAQPGREYAVRLTNRTGERVAIALSVDGLNTIDAKTTSARGASKWVLGPYESVTIDGWQTSSSDARRFFFTTEERSYGAWLGKTRNLGVIAAAVFRERHPRPVAIVPPRSSRAPSAQKPEADGSSASAAGAGAVREMPPEPAPSDDLAATGIGRRVDHDVVTVAFDAEDRASAVLQLRYEYHDALVRLGVVPRWTDGHGLARRERARGFTDGFCPEP